MFSWKRKGNHQTDSKAIPTASDEKTRLRLVHIHWKPRLFRKLDMSSKRRFFVLLGLTVSLCPQLEEDMFSCGGEVRGGRVPPPSLGIPPESLTAVQLRRRHVVAAVIHSENSYVNTLQRLVNVSRTTSDP